MLRIFDFAGTFLRKTSALQRQFNTVMTVAIYRDCCLRVRLLSKCRGRLHLSRSRRLVNDNLIYNKDADLMTVYLSCRGGTSVLQQLNCIWRELMPGKIRNRSFHEAVLERDSVVFPPFVALQTSKGLKMYYVRQAHRRAVAASPTPGNIAMEHGLGRPGRGRG